MGVVFTITVANAFAEHPKEFITVTVYVPALESATFVIVGFCCGEEYPLGPSHAYVPPPLEVRLIVPPVQTGLFALADAEGAGFTVTVVVAVDVHVPLLTVTVYVPLAAVVTLLMFGF